METNSLEAVALIIISIACPLMMLGAITYTLAGGRPSHATLGIHLVFSSPVCILFGLTLLLGIKIARALGLGDAGSSLLALVVALVLTQTAILLAATATDRFLMKYTVFPLARRKTHPAQEEQDFS